MNMRDRRQSVGWGLPHQKRGGASPTLRARQGFTLTELLIVIGVIGGASTLVVPGSFARLVVLIAILGGAIFPSLRIFSVGLLLLHGGGRLREAFREPALWATALAGILRLLKIEPPEMVMRIPRLAGMAAVPLMLVLFGDALSRTRITSLRTAAVTTLFRYASGAIALAITLTLLRPEGMLRKILILYALLPSAVVNVILTQKAGRDAESVASAILLATLVSVVLLPLILIFVQGGM